MPYPAPYTQANITSHFRPGHRPDHDGIDMSRGKGTIICPIWEGVVIETNAGSREGDYRAGYGLGDYVKIRHSNGLESWYAHLSEVLVRTGDRVTASTPIGKEGNTGYSIGSHLHLQIMQNGVPVNPLPYLNEASPPPPNIGGTSTTQPAAKIGFMHIIIAAVVTFLIVRFFRL
jgi:murein DD-endopeptidase MepM/ murein hydrolase activator NlpD